ncbi:radical SAM protein [Sulfurospirillum arcachonense]|uniref:radical SAM protein n=1 Tax=Sulfurospirillum arcachonense TaxID=57666 RepID=UPI00046891C7|nr:radical SAM protein [Sulfurospirillum arcachonense]
MQTFEENWNRIVFDNTPVYFYKHSADWFVPNKKADTLLQEGNKSFEYEKLLNRISLPNPKVYVKTESKSQKNLEEFWLHVTNRCNIECTHCLFSSSIQDKDTLSKEFMQEHIKEAYDLGCRLFVLSGGEPFVRDDIVEIIEFVLSFDTTKVVVLTNGMLAQKTLSKKTLDKNRLSLQISLDGLEEEHDSIRGKGSFAKLEKNLIWLRQEGYSFSISTCLTQINIKNINQVIEQIHHFGATHIHFLWQFSLGRAKDESLLEMDTIYKTLIDAHTKAQELGMYIDNFEALKTQVFAPKGTVHDGSSSGRTTLALGYDGKFYPSAAMVGVSELVMDGDNIAEALQSAVAKDIEMQSITNLNSTMRYILGGGDLDHSFSFAKTLLGDDPYESLHEKLALYLITCEAKKFDVISQSPSLCLEMGDILYTCGASDGVAHTHANCLIATGQSESLSFVKEFYTDAANEDKEDILNPACYEEEYLAHIPDKYRFRGYGCGSPILEANLEEAQKHLDLGSGRGIECFIASKLVGKNGKVVGVDMLDSMLDIANAGAKEVAKNLGFSNLEFHKGYLEKLPLEKESFDVITSNCVLNLSSHKRELFSEIFRVLKPGGRLVVSDVVCDEEASALIRNDAKLSGECIAGALTQQHLLGLLKESGFKGVEFLKRFSYREVHGEKFYSLTFKAYKPKKDEMVEVIYKGLGESIALEDGTQLFKGIKNKIAKEYADALSSVLFILDEKGDVRNQEGESCSCALPPEEKKPMFTFSTFKPKHNVNCMVCKSPLIYANTTEAVECFYCKIKSQSSVTCKDGHFVCDACHSKEALVVIEQICQSSTKTDMIELFHDIREHPSIPKHGPEHHAMVPAIIVTCYKNLGNQIPKNALQTALSRGSSVIGGACGFLGMCGAANGVGIGFAILLESSPVTKKSRAMAQQVTSKVLKEISEYEAARCCNREVWTSLKLASKFSKEFLGVQLKTTEDIKCDQKRYNQYCYGKECPIF